jgi:hypothetical protein
MCFVHPPVNPLEQNLRRPVAEQMRGLIDAGKRQLRQIADAGIVIAGDREILRNLQAEVAGRRHDGEGDGVHPRKDGRWPVGLSEKIKDGAPVVLNTAEMRGFADHGVFLKAVLKRGVMTAFEAAGRLVSFASNSRSMLT